MASQVPSYSVRVKLIPDQKIKSSYLILFLSMAVDFAISCKAEKLILNHFSQRYRSEKDEGYEKEDAIRDSILYDEGRSRALEMGQSENFVEIAKDLKVFNVFRKKS